MRFIFFILALSFVCTYADDGIKIDDNPFSEEKYGYSWNLTSDFQRPESAYFDANSSCIFVSNVIGPGTEKDGQGSIQKLSLDGKMLDASWVEGLNAPKGIRVHDGTLWVSDIDQVVAIDIAEAKIVKKISVPNSAFLNDIAIDQNGIVYVSDMHTNKIHKIDGENITTITGGPAAEYPNGLLVNGDNLIVASWGDRGKKGRLYSFNLKTEEKTLITPEPLGNLDGLELDNDGNYLVSDWVAGKVYKITPEGKIKVLLSGFEGSADIGFIPEKNLLIVPRMSEDKVTAYDLNKYPGY